MTSITQKIARKLRWMGNDALFASGWKPAEKILSGPGQRILAYHGIFKEHRHPPNGRFLSVERFALQMGFLAKNAQVVTLSDYFSGAFDPERFAVALTFDDGYRNNLRYALPVLERHALPATFFLTSATAQGAEWLWADFLDVATRFAPSKIEIEGQVFYKKRWRHTEFFQNKSGQTLRDVARHSLSLSFLKSMESAFLAAGAWEDAASQWEHWALLSPSEIRELADSPMAEIGAHGQTHQDLAIMNPEKACAELRESQKALEAICGKPIRALAYPFGAYTRDLLDFAEKIGFSRQLAVDFQFSADKNDPRLRERLVQNPFVSDQNQWIALKKGRY